MRYFLLIALLTQVFLESGNAQTVSEIDKRITAIRMAADDLTLKYAVGSALEKHISDLDIIEENFQQSGQADLARLTQIQKAIVLVHPAFNNELIYTTRNQYAPDHHNTATLFQKGEINDFKFDPGSALHAVNLRSGTKRILIESDSGIVRDPELSYDGTRIIFSYRQTEADDYHIYEMPAKGGALTQLTFATAISDIDPIYLPDGNIVFSSTREPKYCMCNRHIMANLYRMEADGANIVQLGKNTLFEGHATLLHDGRILYDRWEYVDRNFGDAQGLWTVNPDGTNHAIFYGNNTNSPGGVIDARAVPGSNQVICVFGSCHDRPWGALALLDRTQGVDGEEAVTTIWPDSARQLIGRGNWDQFMALEVRYEDPYPLDDTYFLCSRTIHMDKEGNRPINEKMGIYLVDRFGNEVLLHEADDSCFDPIVLSSRIKEPVIPVRAKYDASPGYFYVQNVYEGTHMEGVEAGSVKYFRVVESPPKRTYTQAGWKGQGEQAPGMNWHSFENKKVLGEAPVEKDGSVYVEIPANKFVYFQLLDADKKMIQSMRSGTMVQSGEVRGCIGCHEDRLSVPVNQPTLPVAMRKPPVSMVSSGEESENFNYASQVQPIFDKHCMDCHDLNSNNKSGLILAGDKNPFFNASYVDLYVKKMIRPIGGGPAEIQAAYSWGSHASKLTSVIENKHHGTVLSSCEKETIYTWLDLNGVYYPFYESAYSTHPAGRSPLTQDELQRLGELTHVNFEQLNAHSRQLGPQISFERPKLSPCLNNLSSNSAAFREAIAIIAKGQKRLADTPRAEMDGFEPSVEQQEMLKKYIDRMEQENASRKAISTGEKQYDRKN